MDKSPDAFRTISEVAEALDTPAHVLRFWETRFPQIRPVKRAGGRRYYRPADVALLTGIKRLLHDEGMTIRGVQKVLREQGIRHVAALAGVTEDDLTAFDEGEAIEAALAAQFSGPDTLVVPEEAETAQVVALETALSVRPQRPAARRAADTVTPFPTPPRDSDDGLAPSWPLPEATPAAAEAPMLVDAEPEEESIFEGIFTMEEPPKWAPPLPDSAPEPFPEATQETPLPEHTIARRLRALRPPLQPGTATGLALQRDRLKLLLDRISPL
jgi:DNA-binding transcriptional MerR regulator